MSLIISLKKNTCKRKKWKLYTYTLYRHLIRCKVPYYKPNEKHTCEEIEVVYTHTLYIYTPCYKSLTENKVVNKWRLYTYSLHMGLTSLYNLSLRSVGLTLKHGRCSCILYIGTRVDMCRVLWLSPSDMRRLMSLKLTKNNSSLRYWNSRILKYELNYTSSRVFTRVTKDIKGFVNGILH